MTQKHAEGQKNRGGSVGLLGSQDGGGVGPTSSSLSLTTLLHLTYNGSPLHMPEITTRYVVTYL